MLANEVPHSSHPLTCPAEPVAREALMAIADRPPAAMVRGDGAWLWDEHGRKLLDFIQGWAVNALGHCPAEIVSALQRQSQTLISASPALHNGPQFELASRLTAASGLAQAHFANSGAEANEAAVKLARKWGQANRPGATEIITTDQAFHGRTLAMMAASGKPGWDQKFPPMPTGFVKVPFGDLAAMQAAVSRQTLAIMVEPIQGEAGVVVPPPGYLEGLRKLAHEAGVLLILDEVQTGIGRTGKLFAFEHESARPDILTLGKGLGGGLPISAMLATREVCCFEYGDQGGTFNGSALMTAGALAVLNAVDDAGFLKNVTERGAQLAAGLARTKGIVEVRGAGLLWAARLSQPLAVPVVTAALQAGLLINAPRPDTLRFMPSLRTTPDEVEKALLLLQQAVTKVYAP